MEIGSRTRKKMPNGLSLWRSVGQSITLPELDMVIHVVMTRGRSVQLVFEGGKKTAVKRTEILNSEFNGPSGL